MKNENKEKQSVPSGVISIVLSGACEKHSTISKAVWDKKLRHVTRTIKKFVQCGSGRWFCNGLGWADTKQECVKLLRGERLPMEKTWS